MLLSTSQVCAKSGIQLSVKQIQELGIQPETSTGTATYWRHTAPELICIAMASKLKAKAKELADVGATEQEAEQNRFEAMMHIEYCLDMDRPAEEIKSRLWAALYLMQRSFAGSNFCPENYNEIVNYKKDQK